MIDRQTVIRLARQAVNSGDGSELSGDAIERFAQLVFLEATPTQPLAEVAEQLRKMVTDQGTVRAVALDIAKWFVNGDRPDEFKLKEWAERLDRDAISKAYEDRSTGANGCALAGLNPP